MTKDTSKSREHREESRTRRWVGRAALRRVTLDLRCFDCGREPVSAPLVEYGDGFVGGGVEFRRTDDGVVGLAGLSSCGRIWLCPVCNAKVMARRAIEIGAALVWADSQGFSLVWGSLTVRHHATSDLLELIDLQRAAWRRVVSSKRWKAVGTTSPVPHAHSSLCEFECERKVDTIDTGAAGRVGYIRASEITIGQVNGWHPHFHPLLVWRGTDEAAQRFADWVVGRWVEAVGDLGGSARTEGGQQLRVIPAGRAFEELGGYVTKATYDAAAIAMELVWSQGKGAPVGRRAAKTSAHWSLLVEIAQGEYSAVQRWEQLEAAVPGHRMITWSRGLRRFAGIGDEVDDETIAAEEVGSDQDSVCFITPDGWQGIRDQPELVALMLSTLEVEGWSGLQVLLDLHGVEYIPVNVAA